MTTQEIIFEVKLFFLLVERNSLNCVRKKYEAERMGKWYFGNGV